MKSVAIITARGGSKRIPRKNIKDFLGKPIIAYSIEIALQSALFSEVMVSTEDAEIADISQKYGAKVPFLRSNENADDFATTAEVLVEVLQQYQKKGDTFEIACAIYPTAPFITIKNLKTAFELLQKENFDTVFPVVQFSYPIQRALQVDKNNRISLFQPENLHARSQDLTPAFHDAGQFYFFKTETFLKKKQLWTDNTGVITIPEMQVQDIDNQEDWELAQIKYQWLKKQESTSYTIKPNIKAMSNFKQWTRDKLREYFGLKRVYDHFLLTEWLQSPADIDEHDRYMLSRWRGNMEKYVDYWNEEEVKLKFIGNLITLVNFDTENLSAFAERELSGTVDGHELSGFPDLMVAKGKQEVRSPFFFLHEYKKELDNNTSDPAAQLLIAMLLAYEKNKDVAEMRNQAIYGTYVVGRNWFFVILKDREYAISDSYAATHQDELFDILRILKVARQKIKEIWGE